MLNFGSVDNGTGAGGYWAINPNNPNDITVKNCSGVSAQLPADNSFLMLFSDTATPFISAMWAYINALNDNYIFNGVWNVAQLAGIIYSQNQATQKAAVVNVSANQTIDAAATDGSGDKAAGFFTRNDYTHIAAASNTADTINRHTATATAATIDSEFNGVKEVVTEQDINGHRIKNSGGIIFEILKNGNIRTNQTVAHNPAYNHQTGMLPIYDEAGVFKGMVMLYTT